MGELAIFEGVRPHLVDADEYIAMVCAGVFGDADVELVEGELVGMAPSDNRHARVLSLVHRALTEGYPRDAFEIYIDAIVQLGDRGVRAPDISVVDRDVGDRKQLLPDEILLAVEISDTTLTEDLGRKRLNYAAADIRHYWVFDSNGGRTHRFTDPDGGEYEALPMLEFSEPLTLPGTGIIVVVG